MTTGQAWSNEVRTRDIAELLGEDVAVLVEAVTSEEGVNRAQRNALTYPKIRRAGRDAVRLKLADRIANVEHGGRAFEMYKKEHAEFRAQLFYVNTDAITMRMWDYLHSMFNRDADGYSPE